MLCRFFLVMENVLWLPSDADIRCYISHFLSFMGQWEGTGNIRARGNDFIFK